MSRRAGAEASRAWVKCGERVGFRRATAAGAAPDDPPMHARRTAACDDIAVLTANPEGVRRR